MLKSKQELEKLDPNSTDIFKSGPIERYAIRPTEIENMCLADFVALFNIKTKSSAQNNEEMLEQDVDEEAEEVEDTGVDLGVLRSFKLSDGTTIKERRRSKIIRYCRYNAHQDPENYFREMIMLFYPWRNEEQDIIQKNCEEILQNNRDLIESNCKKYNAVPPNFEEAIAFINAERELEEESETSGQEEEIVHEDGDDEANVYGYADNVPEFDINVELEAGAYGLDQVRHYVVPDMLSDSAYLELMTSLNIEQRDYVMHVISLLKSNEVPFYHMLSGQAGVGKSRVISAIYQSAIRIFRKEPGQNDEKIEVLLTAPTGKAAHNINGMTLHSAVMLNAGKGSSALHHLSADKQNSLRERLLNLRLIIIDEISMVTGNNFAQTNINLNDIFNTDETGKIFGDRSMILVGDFGQLKPIGNYVFEPPTTNTIAVLAPDHLWSHFKLYELTQVMRQRDDKTFAEALGRLSKGLCTKDDEKMFKNSCFDEQSLPEAGKNAIRLMRTNAEIEIYNSKRLEIIKPSANMSLVFTAVDSVIGNVTETLKRQALHSLELKETRDTHGLCKHLELVTGVRYMVTVNINVSDGLFNGASGILRRIDVKNGKAGTIYIEFDDPKVGNETRKDPYYLKLMSAAGAPTTWTPIKRAKKKIHLLDKGSVQVVREQYPIVCAEAITIYKSQGSSMQSVTVVLGKGMNRQSLYVALSRAVKLDTLFIIGKFRPPAAVSKDDKCIKVIEKMRNESPLIAKFTFLRYSDYMQIISFNVQSIRKHRLAVESDPIMSVSSALLLQETWANDGESYPLDGFDELVRNSFVGRTCAQGTMIFGKPANKFSNTNAIEYNQNGRKIEVTEALLNGIIHIINIYPHPNATLADIKQVISSLACINARNILICSDFNKDLTKNQGLKQYLQNSCNLQMLSPQTATTDANTTLDGVFGRLTDFEVECIIYESFYSFHKPIVIRLKPNIK